MVKPPLIIATLVIGEDYRTNLRQCLDSKEQYAKAHGYTYLQGDEKFWDRTRPISWSKCLFFLQILERLPEGALLWASDADVYISNLSIDFHDHVISLLPQDKDVLLSFDSCGHINGGNIVYRNTPWTRDWIKKIHSKSNDPAVQNHIWWETGAMDTDIKTNAETRKKVEVSLHAAKRFNAYCMGFTEKEHYRITARDQLSPFTPTLESTLDTLLNQNYPQSLLWTPGDFLIHFAGIYDSQQMATLIERMKKGEIPRLNMYNPREELSQDSYR